MVQLLGTLAHSDRDNLRRHIITGVWSGKISRGGKALPQRFELARTIPRGEDLKELPKDGKFDGFFNMNGRTVPDRTLLMNDATPPHADSSSTQR